MVPESSRFGGSRHSTLNSKMLVGSGLRPAERCELALAADLHWSSGSTEVSVTSRGPLKLVRFNKMTKFHEQLLASAHARKSIRRQMRSNGESNAAIRGLSAAPQWPWRTCQSEFSAFIDWRSAGVSARFCAAGLGNAATAVANRSELVNLRFDGILAELLQLMFGREMQSGLNIQSWRQQEFARAIAIMVRASSCSGGLRRKQSRESIKRAQA